KFLAQALRSGESSYWDPYSATGMMGPETLVDVKFSVVNLLSALLGARSSHFTFILLALYLCGVYALLRLLTRYLRISALAAVVACAAFMLNGFALMNLHTPIGQPYFLAPLVLLSLLPLSDRITLGRVVLSILAQVVLFSVTLFPTMVLVTVVAHGIALAHALRGDRSRGWRSRIFLYHVTIPIVAVLV